MCLPVALPIAAQRPSIHASVHQSIYLSACLPNIADVYRSVLVYLSVADLGFWEDAVFERKGLDDYSYIASGPAGASAVLKVLWGTGSRFRLSHSHSKGQADHSLGLGGRELTYDRQVDIPSGVHWNIL